MIASRRPLDWAVVDFGKYRDDGLTIPEIFFLDPDYFYWAYEQRKFRWDHRVAPQAFQVAWRSQSIRLPERDNGRWLIEYSMDRDTGRFGAARLVPSTGPDAGGGIHTIRADVFDLSVPRRLDGYKKFDCWTLLRDFKSCILGDPKARLNKRFAEEFFRNPRHFETPAWLTGVPRGGFRRWKREMAG